MKKVCVCGSFKFYKEMLDLEDKLRKEGIECFGPRKEKSILKCFDKIDKADIVYVVDSNGYVGNSVSADMGYAYAKNKPIYASNPIDDLALMDLINGVLSPKELIELLRKGEK
jgi:nucleoside 2-deoxyribosyltransferase